MKRILAIDYGKARIGTALSSGTLADPLEVIANTPVASERLAGLVKQHGVEMLLVGVSEQAMAEESRKFGLDLAKTLELPVEFEDETLSSVEVQHKLRQTRLGKQQYRGAIDHYAAAVILERYLDEHTEGIL